MIFLQGGRGVEDFGHVTIKFTAPPLPTQGSVILSWPPSNGSQSSIVSLAMKTM